MSKHFSNKVQAILERRSHPSIRILMEEEGGNEEEGGGLFDMPDEPDEEGSDKKSDDSKPESDDDATPDSDSSEDSQKAEDPKQSSEITASEIASDLSKTSKGVENVGISIDDLRAKNNKDYGIGSIQKHIGTYVKVESNRSLTPKNIQSYLFEFAKQDLEYIEKNLDSVQNTIDKADSFVKKYGEGEDVPIYKYVEGAVSAFENFDNLFSKEEFIIQAVCNLLILNTGSQAEKHIEDFKDEFAKELSKKNIVYDDRILKNFDFKNAAGAKATG